MSRRVICISRLLGAGGSDVGRMVADGLGFRLVDEEIVQQAAESSGVSVEELADTERRTKVIDRLTRNLASAGGAAGLMTSSGAGAMDLSGANDPKSLRALIRKSIHETADRGDVVIVSHAASYALSGGADVLRVLVTASPETRAGRIAAHDSVDAKKAAKAVADSDARRAGYLRTFYSVADELPTHYDLALNSDWLSVDVMSDLVVRAASAL
ncbi:MAG TPA: cytidylate kinase-like family protein [Ilumatobacteraceae bacterium]|jgi:cytidylate kinase|nr:cytidylate kinase-like family protein [Ilumatobacteraceae bacterium]